MRLYLVRHGQTDWNIKKQLQGITDIELNATGIEQTEDLARQIQAQGIEFDACYVSPLRRAQKTAQIITRNSIDLTTEPLLVERCFGELEATATDPNTLGIDIYNIELNTSDYGIEPVLNLLARAKQFLDKLRLRHRNDEAILVVAHGALLLALCANIVGYDNSTVLPDFRFKNCEMREYNI